MTTPRYNFDTHLLKLSKSRELDIAKTEWRKVYTETKPDKSGLCICQHTIRHIIYMYNIFTKYTISVGLGCCKKFKLKTYTLDNSILSSVLVQMIQKGEYIIINDILEYTNDVKTNLINYIRHQFTNIKKLNDLKSLHTNIEALIDRYDLKYLQDIYDEIMIKITIEESIENERNIQARLDYERRQRERIENERKQQARIDYERRQLAIIEDEKTQKEWIEYEKKQRELICECGINIINICVCESPKYELMKLSHNLYCAICNKWKCRCNPTI
jgi:hypothetical protein